MIDNGVFLVNTPKITDRTIKNRRCKHQVLVRHIMLVETRSDLLSFIKYKVTYEFSESTRDTVYWG
jgi:hypothetical protein